MDKGRKQKLFDSCYNNVKRVAKRLASSPSERDDLVQEGSIALLHAIDRYDEGRGKLWTFASFWVHGAMLEYKSNGYVSSNYYDTVEDHHIDDAPDPEEVMSEEEEMEDKLDSIRRHLSKLEPMQRRVIELRYLSARPMTLKEVGKAIGKCRQRVFQIETEALDLIRQMVNP